MQGSLIVAGREVGDLPLSIPTSVAIEALFDEHAGDVTKLADKLYVNIRTLFRNLDGCLESVVKTNLQAGDYIDALRMEMENIQSYVNEKSLGKIEVIYYHPSYLDLARKLPRAELRTANTDIQRKYLKLEKATMDMLMSKVEEEFDIKKFSTQISDTGKVILLTHSPIDLIFNNFNNVLLLESHTGKLKKQYEWNSKLTNGSKLTNLPFNKFTIQIFGDKNTYLRQMPSKIRKVVLTLAEENAWSAVTTEDKIRFSVNHKLKDHFAKNFLLQILKS